jgi:FkbM family methyltransferase
MLFTTFDKYITERRGVLHVGAHEGQERDWYKAQGFTKVLWFEPNTKICGVLQQNIKNYENQICFNVGIHDELTKATLHLSNNNGESSSILELGTHTKSHPKVKYVGEQEISLTRMDDFFIWGDYDMADFNFLNIDVQGVELNVLKSFGDMLGELDYIYMEVNAEEVYKGCALLPVVDEYLRRYGFLRIAMKMTRANWGDAFYKRYE